MAAKSPLAIVKERFQTKEALVAAVRGLATDDLWVDRMGGKGLEHVSNAKLLRLHEVLTAVKQELGSRDKLVDAIVAAEGRTKDAEYRRRFDSWSTPRLFDYYRAAKARPAKA